MALPLIVFDVNETLLDLETMEPVFARIFDDKGAMRLWFSNFIMYSAALTVAGCYVPFTEIGAAVIKKNKAALDKNPDWFWHMFAKCEAKAARIAEQAARDPQGCGDATFIEAYAGQLPKLMMAALESRDKALKAK